MRGGDPIEGGGATNGHEPFALAGVLQPGSYTLVTKCEAAPFDSGSTDFGHLEFVFSIEIPEPTTGLLMVAAGAALLRRRC